MDFGAYIANQMIVKNEELKEEIKELLSKITSFRSTIASLWSDSSLLSKYDKHFNLTPDENNNRQ